MDHWQNCELRCNNYSQKYCVYAIFLMFFSPPHRAVWAVVVSELGCVILKTYNDQKADYATCSKKHKTFHQTPGWDFGNCNAF